MGIGTDVYPHKHARRDAPGLVPRPGRRRESPRHRAADVFHAATVGGARALGRGGISAVSTPGCKADFVLVDCAHPAYRPVPRSRAVADLLGRRPRGPAGLRRRPRDRARRPRPDDRLRGGPRRRWRRRRAARWRRSGSSTGPGAARRHRAADLPGAVRPRASSGGPDVPEGREPVEDAVSGSGRRSAAGTARGDSRARPASPGAGCPGRARRAPPRPGL